MNLIRDSTVNISRYLPEFLTKDVEMKGVLDTSSEEHERMRLALNDLFNQFFVSTATWGLARWERILALKPKATDDFEQRRNRILLKLQSHQTSTAAFMAEMCRRYCTPGSEVSIEEHNPQNAFDIVIKNGAIAYLEDLAEAVETYKPAHLAYYFRFVLEFVEEVADYVSFDDRWTADLLAAFKDEVPYGRNITAYKYDNTLQYGGLVAYDSRWQYDGAIDYSGIIPGCLQYGKELEWLFRYAGKASADGEFQYDGAIRYDGLRPYRLEYSDGIDELSVLVLMLGNPGKEAFEDDVLTPMQYNGYGQYDGTLHGGGNPSPMDACGGLEITRAHRYDGSIQYDGGDINYFDGSFQYDGLFRYDGGGTHYRIDHYTDDLDGGLTIVTHQKRPPLAMFHPGLEDIVAAMSETFGAMTAETAFEDDMQGLLRFDGAVRYDGAANAGLVNLPVDTGGTITVVECHRYDGSMDYSGGFTQHYDGAMQYDGAVQIEGGNRFVIVQRYSETL